MNALDRLAAALEEGAVEFDVCFPKGRAGGSGDLADVVAMLVEVARAADQLQRAAGRDVKGGADWHAASIALDDALLNSKRFAIKRLPDPYRTAKYLSVRPVGDP